MKAFIDWHKKYIEWWKKKLKISNYGIVWISFIKGLIIGLLIYHFFNCEIHIGIINIVPINED